MLIKKDISIDFVIIENDFKKDHIHSVFLSGLLKDVCSLIDRFPVVQINGMKINPPFLFSLKEEYKERGFISVGYSIPAYKHANFFPKQIKISSVIGFEFINISTITETQKKYGSLMPFLKTGVSFYPRKIENNIRNEYLSKL